ncbi:MAG: bifunctional DNA primase/polymerase [Pyrinomonadaceae bacterium]|nr:bifunctional DNA primase/polymerase [Pyrinomonadaceae bacterium]
MTPLETAKEYQRRGWQPIPIAHRSKNPNFQNWQNFQTTEADLSKHFNGAAQNIGVLLGSKSGGLTDIDLDTPEAVKIADYFLPITQSEFGRAGMPRSHRLYISDFKKTEQFEYVEMVVEIRSTGVQTVFPGSTHESGESIKWHTDGEPIQVDAQTLRRSVARLAVACIISKFWRVGIRNKLTLALSGVLLRNGFDVSETENFIRAVGAAANDEEISDRLKAIDATARKLESGGNVYGFPKLAELTDKKLVEKICKWLEIEHRQTGEPVHQTDAAKPFKAEKVSQANQILCLAEDIELFHTSDGEPFASIEVGGHIENHRVNSKSFRDFLSYQYYQADGKSPSSQALQDVINSLSGKAKFEGKTQEVFIRLAAFNEKIYLDLCNDLWQIVEIGAGGWRVIEATDAPVRFKRTKAMLALPIPTENGDIGKLKSFLNVDDENLTLILAWLVNCFRPDFPFPVLILSGEQGAAKSTASKVLRGLVDPSLVPFRSAPRNERDLIIAANNAWICAFDNLSNVPDWLSDALCRLSTGGGFGARTLFENEEETLFTAKRPIILNGIGDIANRGDLLNRALPIKLQAIPKHKRRLESEFWAAFEKEKTSIFSALVSAVSFALGQIENRTLPELPRMADFALWATAAEIGLGLKENDFIKAYTQNREDAHSIVLEDSIFAEVLQEFLSKKATDGKYKEAGILLKDLLTELKDTAGETRVKNKEFPKSSKGLRNAIERINPNLREIGIFTTFHGRTGANADKGASLSLEYNCNQTSVTSVTSVSPQNKAQTADVTTDVTQNGKTSNVSNVSNVKSNVKTINTNNCNSLASKNGVTDVTDVTLQSYSNGSGKAEFVDMEI